MSTKRCADNWQHSHSILIWLRAAVSAISGARYCVIYLAVSCFFHRVWPLRTFSAMVNRIGSGVKACMATLGAETAAG